MVLKVLSPGVENTQETNLGTEVFGITRDLSKRLRTGTKKNSVHGFLVLERDRGNFPRNGENNMEVLYGQKFRLPRRKPISTSCFLTLRAVPVPAGVVGNVEMTTALTALHMTAAFCCTAGGYVVKNPLLCAGHSPTAQSDEVSLVRSNNVGHLQRWTGHEVERGSVRRSSQVQGTLCPQQVASGNVRVDLSASQA